MQMRDLMKPHQLEMLQRLLAKSTVKQETVNKQCKPTLNQQPTVIVKRSKLLLDSLPTSKN